MWLCVMPHSNRAGLLYEVTRQCHAYSLTQSRDLSTYINYSTRPAPSDPVVQQERTSEPHHKQILLSGFFAYFSLSIDLKLPAACF